MYYKISSTFRSTHASQKQKWQIIPEFMNKWCLTPIDMVGGGDVAFFLSYLEWRSRNPYWLDLFMLQKHGQHVYCPKLRTKFCIHMLPPFQTEMYFFHIFFWFLPVGPLFCYFTFEFIVCHFMSFFFLSDNAEKRMQSESIGVQMTGVWS